ncbi:Chromosome segregation ATPase [Jatrophihabitans endophyticus]|uniref:Chromosome segregation ATPase n=1 Tax=Jatrophihabitans endophyticus TaxID=1206085 RepID=A0A1M5HLK9_9ACTN|nr:hypothetical protein [Jatrophihabitans endophyticus]SHG16810.1 Chromosome segregation ATPase [Jatrophihabitans endophyticus]
MYEINRARLVGIGPRGARYADVTLDLSGIGAPVGQATLLGPILRRPSPVSLLMLENGGGKTVLLKLLFSVVLPGRRRTVGGASLDKFVSDTDTGHVALEWMNVTTGDLVVTGKVFQRRNRVPAGTNPLVEAWYSFRPTDGMLTFDTLPVADTGRRRRLEGYRDEVREIGQADPSVQVAWIGEDQGQWVTHLRSLGLEPDLFDIQRRMNVDEGDAANAFAFKSSAEFIEWLLTIVSEPEDSVAVADNFEKWSATLAERDSMLLERDFLDGAIAGLDVLAGAHQEDADTAARAAAARTSAQQLAAALAARHVQETRAEETLQGELAEAETFHAPRTTERDRATQVIREVRRQTLRLRQQQTEAEAGEVRDRLARQQLVAAGWTVVPKLAESVTAQARAEEAAQLLEAADSEAAPTLRRRDQAAARLLAGLDAAATTAQTDATDAETRAATRTADAADADGERSSALETASRLEERAKQMKRVVDDAAAKVAAAVASGLARPGTTPRSVPDEAAAAGEVNDAAQLELADRERADADAATALKDATDEERRKRDIAQAAVARRHTAVDAAHTAEEHTRRVAALPAVHQAVGGDEPLLVTAFDDRVDAITAALQDDMDAHTDALDELRGHQRDDQRVLDALGDGGLLPPRSEVERALGKLTEAGIAAHSGWRYLSGAAAPGERPELVAAHPDLADGIVVTDPSQLPAAREVLLEARLLPAAAVTIGSGAALLQLVTVADDRFVVEASPAMYDEQAAAERRDQILSVMAARSESITSTTRQVQELSAARATIAAWRADHPAGHLAALQATAAETTAVADAAQVAHAAAAHRVTEAEQDRQTATEQLGRARDGERAAADRVKDLAMLADAVRAAEQVEADLPGLHDAAAAARRAAEDAETRRDQALAEAEQLRADRSRRRDEAARLRHAMAGVETSTRAVDVQPPTETVAELTAAYDAAAANYRAAAPAEELKIAADKAAETAQSLHRELAMRPVDHLQAARELLAGPDGAAPSLWARAAELAQQQVQALTRRVEEVAVRVGEARTAYADSAPGDGSGSWINLAQEWRPTSIAQGDELLARATVVQRAAQAALDEVTGRIETLTVRVVDAERRAAAFGGTYRPLAAVLQASGNATSTEPGDVPPFAGVAAAAETAAETARDQLQQTTLAKQLARDAARRAHDELIEFTRSEKYEQMRNPLRTALLDSPGDVVAANAVDWSGQMTARRTSLQGELEDALRHRGIIARQLATLVEQALRTVGQASRLSRLPDTLGDWAGKDFLQIRYTHPDAATIATRVGDLLDKLARERDPGQAARSSRRDGFNLLLAGVKAAVPNGFRVTVLKPDQVLRDERAPVEEMNDVFSGGQELTAAILLYCTLAALKANNRGRLRSPHAGVLFLDNPIGKASARYLLDMQTMVAAALNVQLVYTTGLFDDRALASFPLWIRMRNDADLRAGLKYIEVADEMRRRLPDPYEPAGGGDTPGSRPGTVTAARVHLRTRAASGSAPDRKPAGR